MMGRLKSNPSQPFYDVHPSDSSGLLGAQDEFGFALMLRTCAGSQPRSRQPPRTFRASREI
jgi:hypothetical protein